jgi:hypothetical protein
MFVLKITINIVWAKHRLFDVKTGGTHSNRSFKRDRIADRKKCWVGSSLCGVSYHPEL